MKKRILALMIVLIFVFSTNIYGEEMETVEPDIEKAVVLEAGEVDDTKQGEDMFTKTQYVKLKITSGKYKDKIFEIENNLAGNPAYDIIAKEGDEVIVGIEESEDDNLEIYIMQYFRQNYIFLLCGLFVLLLIIVGRGKGIKSIITLTLTMLAILKVLLPLMLKGINPILITILVSIGITIITVFIVSGINSKSVTAIIGTSSGVVVAGLIAYVVGTKANLTGFSSDEAMMLTYIPQKIKFDIKGILFSGIIMGSLGAVMDVAMSISSAMDEVYSANENLTREELFSAGMNIGKDVMGTMTNTLILAYTGSSIPLLLIFMAYKISMKEILNLDLIATEIIRSLSGSIGLVLTIPLTALVASILIKKSEKA